MTIRKAFLALVVGLLAGPALAAQRNIVLFVSDDHGMEAVGCYGNAVIRTPNLDALAAAGTRYEYAFCTTASCSASRSVLLTGLHNHANGHYGHEHSYHHFRSFDRIKSLPVYLSDAGYRTARGGKFHVAPESVFKFEKVVPIGRFEAFIGEDPERPFFYYFCTNEPHRPFAHDPEDRYDPAAVIVPPFLPDTPECREELARYYASVARVDRAVGRIVEALKKTGRYDETLIIYLSDNGVAFPGAKTTVYEPGMRLPCIIRQPGQSRGGLVSKAMISWADVTPTILEFAGIAAAEVRRGEEGRFHGRSFLSTIEEENPAGWEEVYASHTFHEVTMYYPMRVVRTRGHKLIWNIAHPLPYPFASDLWASSTWQGVVRRGLTHYGKRTVETYLQRPQFELYDLEADPHEVNNLAAEPGQAELLEQLKGKLKAFQERTGDPWILKWEYE